MRNQSTARTRKTQSLGDADQQIGDGLADDDMVRLNGSHHELFKGARLLLS